MGEVEEGIDGLNWEIGDGDLVAGPWADDEPSMKGSILASMVVFNR